ncbi:MAG: hypothetical protein J6386_08005 [Candidatus Synoicihabitans palmerolidicus]|nr:hypothetical protein [Candidatus Synoicihabitans palmerolidicus]
MALRPADYEHGRGVEKRADVLWAVARNSRAREVAAQQVAALRTAEVTVDHVESRVTFAEYVERMGRAWLTLSPAGYGHQCCAIMRRC